ncbi:MAG TPA: hypothetical protein H9804_08445 [Candidatus Mucispirillum faecigallinarum]|uniref:Uncharacterized protein n=1 Tax=Candidatus Mucispirillum faecigallinarum TaxID=2838699 RepID=A0A9D2KDE9_9BACT|nr:hypothetical protein [Candidatus Mucispirillum faecigallinarum]
MEKNKLKTGIIIIIIVNLIIIGKTGYYLFNPIYNSNDDSNISSIYFDNELWRK